MRPISYQYHVRTWGIEKLSIHSISKEPPHNDKLNWKRKKYSEKKAQTVEVKLLIVSFTREIDFISTGSFLEATEKAKNPDISFSTGEEARTLQVEVFS